MTKQLSHTTSANSIFNQLKAALTKPNRDQQPFSSPVNLVQQTNLIKYYSDRNAVCIARKLFDEIPKKDAYAWTAIISSYTHNAEFRSSWVMFKNMLNGSVVPNEYTLSSVIKAGKRIRWGSMMAHGIAIKVGVDEALHVANALIDAYGAAGEDWIEDAIRVFEEMEEKNVVAWTTMIASFMKGGDGWGALSVFKRMIQEEVYLNTYTSSIALHACAYTSELKLGKQLHASTIKSNNCSSITVSNSLIDMYSKCHCLLEAKQIFEEMRLKDVITWNTMISVLDRCGSHEAFVLLREMCSSSLEPNCFTYTSIISASAHLAATNYGKHIHGTVFQKGFMQNLQINNALINMYTKCGCIIDAITIFEEMSVKDIVSYTSMMVGYGYNGYAKEAVELFKEMVKSNFKLDSVVFIGLLSACSHGGFVDEGLKYFDSMKGGYNVEPNKDVYGCMIDLLGRGGRVMKAYELIKSMPFDPDESIWGALLGACKMHGEAEMGRVAAKKIIELNPEKGAKTYVMLSNIYASGREWHEAKEARKMVKGVENRKKAGRSWIEIREEVFSFIADDRCGSYHVSLAHEMLELLVLHMDEDEDVLLCDMGFLTFDSFM